MVQSLSPYFILLEDAVDEPSRIGKSGDEKSNANYVERVCADVSLEVFVQMKLQRAFRDI